MCRAHAGDFLTEVGSEIGWHDSKGREGIHDLFSRSIGILGVLPTPPRLHDHVFALVQDVSGHQPKEHVPHGLGDKGTLLLEHVILRCRHEVGSPTLAVLATTEDLLPFLDAGPLDSLRNRHVLGIGHVGFEIRDGDADDPLLAVIVDRDHLGHDVGHTARSSLGKSDGESFHALSDGLLVPRTLGESRPLAFPQELDAHLRKVPGPAHRQDISGLDGGLGLCCNGRGSSLGLMGEFRASEVFAAGQGCALVGACVVHVHS